MTIFGDELAAGVFVGSMCGICGAQDIPITQKIRSCCDAGRLEDEARERAFIEANGRPERFPTAQ